MLNDFLYLMKSELMITLIIFILLFCKLSDKTWKNEAMLGFINILLLINLASGFFYIPTGSLFGDMFRTNELLTLEKNFLNLGTLIISLQSYHWLKNHKQVPETHINGNSLQIFSFILLLAGFGFKISAVPFHLWTADVYEGSPVAVTSYLSVVSKGAILFVMVSVFYNVFSSIANSWYNMIFLISVVTMIIGNLFALRQRNMKRFLAFSSIAQIGFILVGLSSQSVAGSSSVIYFILIYIFSNLGAFGVISLVSAISGKENMDDYKGFYRTNPLLSWVLAISLFSLAGVPPMAGFFGKFFLLFAGAGKGNYLLIVIAALNMVVSLYYYLKVIKTMFMDSNENPIEKIHSNWQPKIAMAICIGGILITGLASGAYNYIYSLIR